MIKFSTSHDNNNKNMMFVDELETLAKLKFNLDTLKPFQQAIISDFMHGHDVLVISPTGSGKSLCYQLPALLLPGTFIIISPLIALMQDQVEKLKSKSIEADFLHADLSKEEQNQIFASIKTQKTKLLYVSPERLLQNFFLSFLKQQKISGFAIDEVHCMLQWGQDFRPEYQGLSKLKKIFPRIPVMALTATANPKHQQSLIEQLSLKAKKHIYSIHRPNIHYHVIKEGDSKNNLAHICSQHPHQSGIVYAASRLRVENIYAFLKSKGFETLKYHAGLSAEEKQNQLALFQNSSQAIMVATIAFGMGVDKKDIRYIVHLDTPGRLDQFVQESGRVGRDGQEAHSYIFFQPAPFFQFNFWRIQKAQALLFPELIEDLKMMAKFLNSQTCFNKFITDFFEEQDNPDCGYCSRCQNQSKESVSSDDFLKVLSCIARLEDAATSKVLIEVLQGQLTTRTHAYQGLSTFGIGQDQSVKYWLGLIALLFSHDWISIRHQSTMNWVLTAKAKMAMKHRNYADILNHQPLEPLI